MRHYISISPDRELESLRLQKADPIFRKTALTDLADITQSCHSGSGPTERSACRLMQQATFHPAGDRHNRAGEMTRQPIGREEHDRAGDVFGLGNFF